MEGKPDDGSSPPPFHGFKDLHKLEQEHHLHQEHHHQQQQQKQAMGQVSQDFAFPSGEASEIANPWPSLLLHSLSPLHFSSSSSSSPTTTSTSTIATTHSSITNYPIPLLQPSPLPPFPPRIPYGYEGLLLPPESPLNLATAGLYGGHASTSASPFGSLHSEFSKMTAQEIMDAKALAASRSHSEAERRRRERINSHLARLRSLLPNTTKTDKASLLAEVIQHVKELKRQTSEIAEGSPVPTEADELVVEEVDDDEGRFVVRASLCCDDRPDLLPELIKALRAMRLRALKAEIVTLGGRMRNVLLITGQDDGAGDRHTVASIQEALRGAMEKAATAAAGATGDEPSTSNSGGSKRQRTGSLTSILENRSI